MPQFGQQDGFLTVAVITGPQHVLLGLRFGFPGSKRCVLHCRPSGDSCGHAAIDEAVLERAIAAGVAAANAELGLSLEVEEAFYLENDTPSYRIYEQCAYLLAKRKSQAAA